MYLNPASCSSYPSRYSGSAATINHYASCERWQVKMTHGEEQGKFSCILNTTGLLHTIGGNFKDLNHLIFPTVQHTVLPSIQALFLYSFVTCLTSEEVRQSALVLLLQNSQQRNSLDNGKHTRHVINLQEGASAFCISINLSAYSIQKWGNPL